MSRLMCALAVLVVAAPAFAEDEMWRWTEDDGTPHYTNDKSTIPQKYRAKASKTTGDEIGVVKTQEGATLPDPVADVIDKLGGSGKPIEAEGSDEEEAPPPAKPDKNARFTNDVRQVIVFGASWCQPCLMLKKMRTLEALVEAHPELKLREVDGDVRPELAKKYSVSAYPTIVFTDTGGKEFLRVRGPKTLAQLERALSAARGPQVN